MRNETNPTVGHIGQLTTTTDILAAGGMKLPPAPSRVPAGVVLVNKSELDAANAQIKELKEKLAKAEGDAFRRGAECAASVARTYNGCTSHPYDLGDCILGKMNLSDTLRNNDRANAALKTFLDNCEKLEKELEQTQRSAQRSEELLTDENAALREQMGKMEHMIGDVAVWAIQNNWQSLSGWASSLKIEYNRDGTPFVDFTPVNIPSPSPCPTCEKEKARADAAITAADQVQFVLNERFKEINTLRGALKFYANRESYVRQNSYSMGLTSAIDNDAGEIARQALSLSSPSTPENPPAEEVQKPQEWAYAIKATTPRLIIRATRPGQERFWKQINNVWYTSEGGNGPWFWSEDVPPGVARLIPVDSPPPALPTEVHPIEHRSIFKCIECTGPLHKVKRSANSPLNEEQFDASKAGDYYCKSCKGNRGNTGYRYFWERELLPDSPPPASPSSVDAPREVENGGGL